MKFNIQDISSFFVISLQIFSVTVLSLQCYHDEYAPPGPLTNTTQIGNKADWVKRCGVKDDCRACMTVKTTSSHHDIGEDGKQVRKLRILAPKSCEIYLEDDHENVTVNPHLYTTIVHNEVVSRVCVTAEEKQIEDGCEKLGPPGTHDVTVTCYCFKDKCN